MKSGCRSQSCQCVMFFNGGHTKTNTYQETPIRVVRDLLSCGFNSVIITNKILYQMHQDMAVERAVLQQQPHTKEVLDLHLAAARLNLPTYKSYKSFRMKTSQYNRTVSPSPSESGQLLKIQSTTNPHAPPRFICLPSRAMRLLPENRPTAHMCP